MHWYLAVRNRDKGHSEEKEKYSVMVSNFPTYARLVNYKTIAVNAIFESESEVAQSCLTLCNPMDCSPPGSSLHGILQARLLEWVAISFSRVSSQPRDRTQVSRIAGRRFNLWATREALYSDDTTLTAECKKELKGLWWRWKRRVKNLV